MLITDLLFSENDYRKKELHEKGIGATVGLTDPIYPVNEETL